MSAASAKRPQINRNGPATTRRVRSVYDRLLAHFGPRRWWPAESPFEVCVGAVLTQNTAWSNVEKAIANLKTAGALSPAKLMALDDTELASLIKPSGYFNLKTRRLKALVRFLVEQGGSNFSAFAEETDATFREKLLAVYGVGPETADSILLYAFDRPLFVCDAYTRRIAGRLGLCPPESDYRHLQAFFTTHLPLDVALFNDYHAQLVALGATYCKPRPRCESCPLDDMCPKSGLATQSLA